MFTPPGGERSSEGRPTPTRNSLTDSTNIPRTLGEEEVGACEHHFQAADMLKNKMIGVEDARDLLERLNACLSEGALYRSNDEIASSYTSHDVMSAEVLIYAVKFTIFNYTLYQQQIVSTANKCSNCRMESCKGYRTTRKSIDLLIVLSW